MLLLRCAFIKFTRVYHLNSFTFSYSCAFENWFIQTDLYVLLCVNNVDIAVLEC